MNELREIAQPLLTDSPHPPPSIDELQRRVNRRRRRRAGTISGCWFVVLVLVVAAILVARDGDTVQVANDPSPPTTVPPPALAPVPVQMVVSPESSTLDIPRTIEVRNTGSKPYSTCGFTVDLFRWTGNAWAPVGRISLSEDPLKIRDYVPEPVQWDCTPSFVPAGTSTAFPFAPGGATWLPTDGMAPRTDRLGAGWYELREVPQTRDEAPPAFGRFQVTAGSEATTDVPSSTTINGTPISFQVTTDTTQPSSIRLRLPGSLTGSDSSCKASLLRVDDLAIPEVRVQPLADPAAAGCTPEALTLAVVPASLVLGLP